MAPLPTAANGRALDLDDVPVLPPDEFHVWVRELCGGGGRLAALFGDPRSEGTLLYALVTMDEAGEIRAGATRLPAGRGLPALTPELPQAHLFERELAEQLGVDIVGHPWLKPVRRHPELTAGPSDGGGGNRYPFFTVRGMQVHEVAVGPVHAGIIEPGHFRFQCYGEKVLHLEIQLGYQHRGIEALLSTADGPKAAILAESVAGDSTVAHALAHCELVEALAACAVPPRALAIRLLALELERVTNHLGDLGMLANDVGFLQPAALFGRLRGEFLNLTLELAGNRLGRGLCRAGGVKHDIDLAMAGDWRARLPRLRREAAAAADVFFSTPALLARLEGVGRLPRTAAERLGLVGPAARASGCSRDVRRDHPAGAYLGRTVSACTCTSGDVQARANVRWLEVLQSLQLIASWLDDLPESDVRAPCASLRPNALGVALTEGWRGETLHAAITDGEGRIRRYKVVDPSFHNWIGLALAMRDEAISDFPLCNKSFNLSYAGHDL